MAGVKTLSEYEKGWLSGVIDGEGSISVVWHNRKLGRLRKNGRRSPLPTVPPCPTVRITVTNTYIPFLEKVKEVTGVGTIHPKLSKRHSESRRKPGWTYQCSNQSQVRQVLDHVELIIKEELRILALELLDLKTQYKRNGQGTNPEIRLRAIEVAQKMCSLNDGRKEEHNARSSCL